MRSLENIAIQDWGISMKSSNCEWPGAEQRWSAAAGNLRGVLVEGGNILWTAGERVS